MSFEEWTEGLSKGIIQRTEETPGILNWIHDPIDEDLEEEDPPSR